MNVFFDNNCPPLYASTLDGYVSHFGHRAYHIKDISGLPRGRDTPDLEWITFLGRDERVWLVITEDKGLHRNPAIRRAFREAGLFGLVLARGYQKMPINQRVSNLLWFWPEIEKLFQIVAPPALYEIPVRRGQLRAFSL